MIKKECLQAGDVRQSFVENDECFVLRITGDFNIPRNSLHCKSLMLHSKLYSVFSLQRLTMSSAILLRSDAE